VVVLFFFHVGSIPKSSLATSLLTSFVGDHTIPTASLPPCQWSSCLSPLFILSCHFGHCLIWKACNFFLFASVISHISAPYTFYRISFSHNCCTEKSTVQVYVSPSLLITVNGKMKQISEWC
jgi:hypothetical protein